jgi:hypothetical protein
MALAASAGSHDTRYQIEQAIISLIYPTLKG